MDLAAAHVGPPVAIAEAGKPKAKTPSKRKRPGTSVAGLDQEERKAPPPTRRALRYLSSGDACVDFFFQVVPGVAADDVATLLSAAWSNKPERALKLVCNLRGVREFGKSDGEGFYAAALWMHANHPRTLARSLPTFASIGCLKDLLEIVFRVLHGSRGERKDDADGAVTAKARQKEVEHAQGQITISRYRSDSNFRHLYDSVAEHFNKLLKADLKHLSKGHPAKIGLAAKWCPSVGSSYDRSTLLCECIARLLFPRESMPEYQAMDVSQYVYRVRNRLHLEVLVPLRKALKPPEEAAVQAGVPSRAIRQYKEAFQKHDKSGVADIFEKVHRGLAEIPADAVLPHEIVAAALNGEHDLSAELQWSHMVSDLASYGNFTNCVALCALSSSAEKPPAATAIALALLISELNQAGRWKSLVITFGTDKPHPQLKVVRGKSLVEKLRELAAERTHKGANLDAVLEIILKIAVEVKMNSAEMVKRVFVLSDMELDRWVGGDASVLKLDAIRESFHSKGYIMPEVVFWNVGTSMASVPAVADQVGVALVSGYSENLLRLFLRANGVLSPSAIMADAISDPEYDELRVID